jgi:lysophospholipase L1-like esterase
MNKHSYKKKAWISGLVIFLVIIAIIYFNRSYAYIYDHIDKMALKSPDRNHSFLVVNNKTASSSLTYVALGDSLTAGVGTDKYSDSYPYLLAQYFAGNNYQIDLEDRAVPGVKTEELLNGLVPAAIKDQPDIVTLLIGVNDVHGMIDRKDFRKNYETILQMLTKETKAKIYVINIPLIGASNLVTPPYNLIFDYRTQQYNKIIKELADKYSVNYIDLYTPTKDLLRSNGPHYASDFFHPSKLGYKIWADLIYADTSQ